MLPMGFDPTMPKSEQAQIHALDRTATGIVFLLKDNIVR
jgi:hypothetical protein